MSTTLLIGRWPAALRRAFSHSGEGPIVTFSNARTVKRGHSSGERTSTETPGISSPAGCSSRAHGGGFRAAPVAAWTSRATP